MTSATAEEIRAQLKSTLLMIDHAEQPPRTAKKMRPIIKNRQRHKLLKHFIFAKLKREGPMDEESVSDHAFFCLQYYETVLVLLREECITLALPDVEATPGDPMFNRALADIVALELSLDIALTLKGASCVVLFQMRCDLRGLEYSAESIPKVWPERMQPGRNEMYLLTHVGSDLSGLDEDGLCRLPLEI